MKLNELLYKTPEMTEEKLLEYIKENLNLLKPYTINRLINLYLDALDLSVPLEKCVLMEWDVINNKESYLTRSQRDEICGLVSTCLIMMTKNYGTGEFTSSESTS